MLHVSLCESAKVKLDTKVMLNKINILTSSTWHTGLQQLDQEQNLQDAQAAFSLFTVGVRSQNGDRKTKIYVPFVL